MAERGNLEFYKGEHFIQPFALTTPQDIAGWTIRLTLKGPDGDVYIDGTVLNPTSAGRFQIEFTHAFTNALPFGQYGYDVQRIDAGAETVLRVGLAKVLKEYLY